VSDGTTLYGFKWGQVEVQRMIAHKGYKLLNISTPYREIVIQVSPTGSKVHVVQTKRRRAVDQPPPAPSPVSE
jgi:hypothetical protein